MLRGSALASPARRAVIAAIAYFYLGYYVEPDRDAKEAAESPLSDPAGRG